MSALFVSESIVSSQAAFPPHCSALTPALFCPHTALLCTLSHHSPPPNPLQGEADGSRGEAGGKQGEAGGSFPPGFVHTSAPRHCLASLFHWPSSALPLAFHCPPAACSLTFHCLFLDLSLPSHRLFLDLPLSFPPHQFHERAPALVQARRPLAPLGEYGECLPPPSTAFARPFPAFHSAVFTSVSLTNRCPFPLPFSTAYLPLPFFTALFHCPFSLPFSTALSHCPFSLPFYHCPFSTALFHCLFATALFHCPFSLPLFAALIHCPISLPCVTARSPCPLPLPLTRGPALQGEWDEDTGEWEEVLEADGFIMTPAEEIRIR